MRKIIVVAAVLFAIFLAFSVLYFRGMANAKERVERVGNSLVVIEEKEVAKYPDVPKEIPEQIALKMLRGETKTYNHTMGSIESVYSLVPLPAKLKVKDLTLVYQYTGGEWGHKLSVGAPREETNWFLPLAMLVPILFFLVAYIANRAEGKSIARLALFFATLALAVYLIPMGNMGSAGWISAAVIVVADWLLPAAALLYAVAPPKELRVPLVVLWGIGCFFSFLPIGVYQPTRGAIYDCEAILVVGCATAVAIAHMARKVARATKAAKKEVAEVQQ